MNLKEMFDVWASETPLLETAFERKKAIEIIRSKQMELSGQLIKILAFNSPENYNHWCNEINNWMFDIKNIKWNRKNRFKPHEYMYWLWEEPLGHGVEAIEDAFYGFYNILTDYDYKNLPKTNLSNQQIFEIIHKIYDDLTFDLSKGQVKRIQDYLQKYS